MHSPWVKISPLFYLKARHEVGEQLPSTNYLMEMMNATHIPLILLYISSGIVATFKKVYEGHT